ncbi:hypothetical protein BU23DRAFT_225163 [Bimuria novae-zelandiae CBS 107.79]|uniref:Uncharacterized protein n=1 Tax=Bimuria novae-zelandiae CBS 107.79 TaxID=1447943 RepID=A0A6A5VNI3_9PLEO|nr:hypothetical protein BU23DRAFT_225163 [Bimuria novae-zelandiae CBS 107.79]
MGLAGMVTGWLVVQVLVWGVGALDCKKDASFTIASADDVAALNKCAFFNGSVTISADAPQNIEFSTIRSMRSLEAISADTLRSISSDSLESIDDITFTALPNLASFNFSSLRVLETIRLESLPSIKDFGFGQGLGPRIEASVVNTSLKSVDWLKWPVSTTVNITSNEKLEAVSLPWETIDSAVTISDNAALKHVNVFAVETVAGNFTLEKNNKIEELVFKSLKTVEGKLQISGVLKNISMPALDHVYGELSVQSTKDIQDLCSDLEAKNLKGKFECKSYFEEPTTPKTASIPPKSSASVPVPSSDELLGKPEHGDDDHDEDDGGDITVGAKVGIALSAVVLAVFVFVGISYIIRARVRGKVMEIVPSVPGTPMVVPKPDRKVSVRRVQGRTIKVVQINLNGREMREVSETGERSELGREGSMRSVSSLGSNGIAGSEARLVKDKAPTSPVSPV